MPITESRIERLRDFGLSQHAARAYLALLDLGVAEARDVSTLSRVPTSKIYHVLEHLHEKGLVTILPEFPKKYAPVAFTEYLDKLQRDHEAAARAILRDREEMASLFTVMGDVEVNDRGLLTLVRGRRNVLEKISEFLGNCTSDLLVVGTPGLAGRYVKFIPELERARRRGVRIRFLVPLPPELLGPFESLAGVAEVRARDLSEEPQSSNVGMLLADNARAFLVNFVPDDDNMYTGKDLAVFTDQEALVAAIQSLVEVRWRRAPAYEDRRLEVETGRLSEFTRVYARASEAYDALNAAFDRGIKTLRSVNATPARTVEPAGRAVLERANAVGAECHALINVTDAAAAQAYMQLAREFPNLHVRHLDPSVFTRFAIVDEREAFFSINEPVGGAGAKEGKADPDPMDLAVHTSHRATLSSLRGYFDEAWARSIPLELRVRELERFPHVQPRELGIGRLFDSMRDAVVISDQDGHIVLWNAAATQVFGYTTAEALQMNVDQLVPTRFRAQHRAGMARYRETGEGSLLQTGQQVELPAARKDGTEIDIELTLSEFRHPGVKPLVLAIVRDVSARTRAEAEARRLHAQRELILDSTRDGVYGVDDAGRITFVNRAAAQMVGYARAELEGQPMHELVHHSRPDGSPLPLADCPVARAWKHGETVPRANDTFWRKDGTSFPVELVCAPIHTDGKLTGAVVTFRPARNLNGGPPPRSVPVKEALPARGAKARRKQSL